MGHERRLRLFIYARIIVTFLFLASTIVFNLNDPNAIDELSLNGVVRLMAFSFLFSVISHYFLKVPRFQFFITYLQTIWDLLFVTVLLLFTGGVTSPYSFLYLLSIMNAGVLLGRREAFYTASLCGILYGAIIDFQYFGMLNPIGLSRLPAQQLGAMHILYTIFLHLMGFYLTCFITGYLSDLAKQSEAALLKQNVNYDELERLNSTIVSNLESGLMTITSQGNIRVFNRYAEELTGKSQQEVYDLPLGTVFPGMKSVLEDMGTAIYSQFTCAVPGNPSMVLGYSTVPFTDTHGEIVGVIINFKDLTSKIQMEEALKRTEKLAALGELSARMAHEIRNPLASMSGSVQLLADHGPKAESDQRLLAIILRETDRLNSLITEFLTYARPVSPRKESIHLFSFIDDIRRLAVSDRRFEGIAITNSVPSDMVINADGNQMRQVLFNLLNNAAEATPPGGCIEIAGCTYAATRQEFSNDRVAVITVSDNGSGIPAESAKHLFEPFWTTKNDGTGLGLAISYRIIEEHGGKIRVESPPDGGSRFTITLPL
jgi:two-component system sensor histidine kinase PilS (NtrC family)